MSANPAVLTCLGNDIGYDQIYSEQLRVKACSEDVLITLSGSGNSPNIINALNTGNTIGMKTFAILGTLVENAKKLLNIYYAVHLERFTRSG